MIASQPGESLCRRLRGVAARVLLVLLLCPGWGHAQESGPVARDIPARTKADFGTRCATAEVSASVFGHDQLVEYVRGRGCLIVAAPHGGRQMPEGYTKRRSGVLVTDSNTDVLARAIREELVQQFDHPAHLIICHLRRLALDANRPLEAACEPGAVATQVWHDYQHAINYAKRDVTSTGQRGLFVEIHGHGHAAQRLELGYLLRGKELALPRTDFNALVERSSVREIVMRGQCDLDTLVRGEQSLGAMLQRVDLPVVPSPQLPAPGEDPYFNGGWNTRQHGSRDGGVVSSIQIEFHREGVRDSDQAVRLTARRVARALNAFLCVHYPDSPSTSPNSD